MGCGRQLRAPSGERAALLGRLPDAGAPRPPPPRREAPGRTAGFGNESVPRLPDSRLHKTLPARRIRPDFRADSAEQGAGSQPGTAEQPASSVRTQPACPDQHRAWRGKGPSPRLFSKKPQGFRGPKSETWTKPARQRQFPQPLATRILTKPQTRTARCRSV